MGPVNKITNKFGFKKIFINRHEGNMNNLLNNSLTSMHNLYWNIFLLFPLLVMILNTSWHCVLISTQISTPNGTTSRLPTPKQECRTDSPLSTSPSQQACIIVACVHYYIQKQKQRSTKWGGKGQEIKSSIIKTISAMMGTNIFPWHGLSSFHMTGILAILPTAIHTLTATCKTTCQPLPETQDGPNSAKYVYYVILWLGI